MLGALVKRVKGDVAAPLLFASRTKEVEGVGTRGVSGSVVSKESSDEGDESEVGVSRLLYAKDGDSVHGPKKGGGKKWRKLAREKGEIVMEEGWAIKEKEEGGKQGGRWIMRRGGS